MLLTCCSDCGGLYALRTERSPVSDGREKAYPPTVLPSFTPRLRSGTSYGTDFNPGYVSIHPRCSLHSDVKRSVLHGRSSRAYLVLSGFPRSRRRFASPTCGDYTLFFVDSPLSRRSARAHPYLFVVYFQVRYVAGKLLVAPLLELGE